MNLRKWCKGNDLPGYKRKLLSGSNLDNKGSLVDTINNSTLVVSLKEMDIGSIRSEVRVKNRKSLLSHFYLGEKMGYCIQMGRSNFHIKKENKEKALAALKKLGDGSNDSRANGGDGNIKWFSWMNDTEVDQWDSIAQAMDDWRYPIHLDAHGNVDGISFQGEKLGQENLMFEVIAPFVEPDSYIDIIGEDGCRWKLVFDGNVLKIENIKNRK